MPDGDKLDRLLMAVGETKGKVDGICEDVASIKGQMLHVVTRKECTGKHKMMEESLARTMSEVKTELQQGLCKIQQSNSLSPQEMEAALSARAEARAEKRRKLITWYLGTAVVIAGILGTVGTFVYKMVRTLDQVHSTMVAQPVQLRREIDKATSKQRIVYVEVPAPHKEEDNASQPLPARRSRRAAVRRAAANPAAKRVTPP